MKEKKTWLDYCGSDWYGEQDENGIDLSLIRENLKLTPLQRIRKGADGTFQAKQLMEYGRRHRESIRANSTPTS